MGTSVITRAPRIGAVVLACAAALAIFMPAQRAEAKDMDDWQRAALGMGPGGYAGAERSSGRVPRAVAEAGDEDAGTRVRRRGKSGKRVASLGSGAVDLGEVSKKSLSGGGVRWVASSGCLSGALASVIQQVAASYGPVTVSSTCRSHASNRRAGGAPKSYHLSGSAADFRVHGNAGAVYAFLKSNGSVGGLKHYGGGLFHIDTGPRRSF